MTQYPHTIPSFHIEIRYTNGDIERPPIMLDGGYWANGEHAHSLNTPPSHSVDPSDRCEWRSDSFMTAIGEGKERSGCVSPDDDDEPFEAFEWKIVGSEADLCRERMAYWLDRLGEDVVLAMPYDGQLDDFERLK